MRSLDVFSCWCWPLLPDRPDRRRRPGHRRSSRPAWRHAGRRATRATARRHARRRGAHASPDAAGSPGGTSPAPPATELRFHLYWNAWRDRSPRGCASRARGDTGRGRAARQDLGSIDLTQLARRRRRAGPAARARVHCARRWERGRPDGPVRPARSARRPGETIEHRSRLDVRVPRPFARTGAIGNYFFVAQWFPKIGVLEDTGWNCHQFHAATEFFADFGTLRRQPDGAAGWLVGATGREQSRTDNRQRHDDASLHRERRARLRLDDEPGLRRATEPSSRRRACRPWTIRLLLQPEHAEQADRHFDATRAALKYYRHWFGPYPYGHITVVDPVTSSTRARRARARAAWSTRRSSRPARGGMRRGGGTEPESVTVHEAGHQFWYGIVATNEFEHAWMDEGLNTYSDGARAGAKPGRTGS